VLGRQFLLKREEITGDKKKNTQWEASQFELLNKCYGDKIKEQKGSRSTIGKEKKWVEN